MKKRYRVNLRTDLLGPDNVCPNADCAAKLPSARVNVCPHCNEALTRKGVAILKRRAKERRP